MSHDGAACMGHLDWWDQDQDQERWRWLVFEQRFEEGFDIAGDLLIALGGGVGVVGLHAAGDTVDAFEEEGKEADVVLPRESGIHGVEFFDVVGAVAGGEGDAGEDDLDAAGL